MTHPAFTKGNVAVVTGAALGIGRAAALRFAEMGLKVCLVDLPSDDLVTAAAEAIGKAGDASDIIAIPTDVSAPDQVVERIPRGIEAGSFYIVCPDDDVTEEEDRRRILWGAGDITEDRPALSRWDPTVEHTYHAFKP